MTHPFIEHVNLTVSDPDRTVPIMIDLRSRLGPDVMILDWRANSQGLADALTVERNVMRLIFMVVLPLVFCALTLGVVELGDVRRLGRVGLRTLLFTVIMSVASVAIGLFLVNTVRPGARLSDEQRKVLRERYASEAEAGSTLANAQKAKTLRDTLLDIIPKNPLQEMVGALVDLVDCSIWDITECVWI